MSTMSPMSSLTWNSFSDFLSYSSSRNTSSLCTTNLIFPVRASAMHSNKGPRLFWEFSSCTSPYLLKLKSCLKIMFIKNCVQCMLQWHTVRTILLNSKLYATYLTIIEPAVKWTQPYLASFPNNHQHTPNFIFITNYIYNKKNLYIQKYHHSGNLPTIMAV